MTTPFTAARDAWNAGRELRAMRRRLKKFTYGRQWDDPVTDAFGNRMTEGSRMARHGHEPITHNLLRSFIKTVVGRFRHLVSQEEGRELTPDQRRNLVDELDARSLEEFLISGCAIQRIVIENRDGVSGAWVDNVSPSHFFCNRFEDIRGADVKLLGMLHEMSLNEVCLRYGHGSASRARLFRETYDRCRDKKFLLADGTSPIGMEPEDESFAQGRRQEGCRVIEVWAMEADERGKITWKGGWYAPDGTLLDQTDSPYAHGSHPFVFKFYPLTDGEVHPFIEDVIDQQKYINRLINVIDHIMSQSAKGVLLLPTDTIADGFDYGEVLAQWNQPGGVIPINPRAQRLPMQVQNDGSSASASSLLDIELKLIQQVSGISGALQGQGSGVSLNSAAIYQAQADNASIALLDIFETFNSFRMARDRKMGMVV